MYSLDTSVFMDWQARFYPLDIFVSLGKKIDELIRGDKCSAVELVREEIDAVGTPELREWARKHRALLISLDPLIQIAGLRASNQDIQILWT